jgi:putative phage-type endonuclease
MSKYTTHELQQGSPEWLAYRANTLNASDAGTALGINPYKTRAELIRELATGLTKEVDSGTQRRFDDGHRFEKLAMPLAEAIIGEPLSATTVSCAVPGLKRRLSASLDGATFGDTENAEHKTLSESLAAAMDRGEIPEQYPPQMEQGMMVTGATRCLFIASKWDANDQLIDEKHIWYESNPELRAKIIAAWKQVEADVDAYVPSDIKEMPKAAVVVDLPALFVHAKGEITTHNMDEFGKALALRLAVTRAIVLVTDQDFSNAKESAKKFRETAKAIALSKDAMLAQTETIGEAARKMDAWAEDLNATALQLEKDVKREDLAKKEAMVLTAKGKYTDHIAALEAETKPIRLALVAPNFADAIKGKSKYASMQDAVDTMMAGAVIDADKSAKDVREKLAWCKDHAAGYSALFPDLQQIIVKPMEDFALTITSRIDKAKADEAKKLEAIKEAARIEAEANAAAKVKADQDAAEAQRLAGIAAAEKIEHDRRLIEPCPVLSEKSVADAKAIAFIDSIGTTEPAAPAAPGPSSARLDETPMAAAPDDGARIRLGEISERLGFTVTADFIASLGFQPVETIKAAKLYRESEFPSIVASLIVRLEGVLAKDWRAAA